MSFGYQINTFASVLSNANKQRLEIIFESIYRDLYAAYQQDKAWMKRLTIITFFSNFLLKCVGCHPKTGKKKGGIKVHTVIHANEGVPSDIKFTSAVLPMIPLCKGRQH